MVATGFDGRGVGGREEADRWVSLGERILVETGAMYISEAGRRPACAVAGLMSC